MKQDSYDYEDEDFLPDIQLPKRNRKHKKAPYLDQNDNDNKSQRHYRQ